MLYAAFISLLAVSALCFGLGRAVPARALGLGAAGAALAAAALVAFAPVPGPEAAPTLLLELGSTALSIWPALATGERGIAAAMLVGGSATLLALAGAIGPSVRGFGAIFAWALLALAAALLSLAAPPLSLAQPLAWAVLSIGAYGALRASGAGAAGEGPPLGLSFGLLASALLAGGLLASGASLESGELPPLPAALCGLLAALGLAGAPPLAAARAEAAEAPAPLGALIYGLAAPAAGLGWLLRAVAALPVLPADWALTLGLIGAVGALACGAGALGVQRLRPLLSWVSAGQAAAVVAAAGLAGPLAALAGPGLLLSLMLSAAVGAGAVASLDRTTGSDSYTAPGEAPPRVVGLAWALAAAASLGLPPLWGLWPRLWLLQAAQEEQPWLLAPLLAGGVLTVLALLAPLGRLWGPRGAQASARAGWPDTAPAILAALPLLAFGIAPGLAWAPWLSELIFAPPELPASLTARAAAIGAGLVLAVIAVAVTRARPAREAARDPDELPAHLAPEALGAALRPLAWLGAPMPLLGGLWAGLARASDGLRFLVGLFEQRYYLLGVLAALITIMLLMAQ